MTADGQQLVGAVATPGAAGVGLGAGPARLGLSWVLPNCLGWISLGYKHRTPVLLEPGAPGTREERRRAGKEVRRETKERSGSTPTTEAEPRGREIPGRERGRRGGGDKALDTWRD